MEHGLLENAVLYFAGTTRQGLLKNLISSQLTAPHESVLPLMDRRPFAGESAEP